MTIIERKILIEDIRNKIKTLLDRTEEGTTFSDNDSLVISGRLSSLQVIELSAELENKYGLDFNKHGFNQYDFDTVNSLVSLIEKHKKGIETQKIPSSDNKNPNHTKADNVMMNIIKRIVFILKVIKDFYTKKKTRNCN